MVHPIDARFSVPPPPAGVDARPPEHLILGGEMAGGIDVTGDAREEMGFAIAQWKSERPRAFGERKVDAELLVKPMQVSEVDSYIDASHRYDDRERLRSIIESIQNSLRPDVFVRTISANPGDRLALLHAALNDANQRGMAPQIVSRLEEALAAMTHAVNARARATLVKAAEAFKPAGTAVGSLQSAYDTVALGTFSFDKTFQLVLRLLGGERGAEFARSLETLRSSLGADISAARPASDPLHVRFLVQEVTRMGNFVVILEDCTALAQRIEAEFGISTVDPVELLKALVSIIGERWIQPARLHAMAARFGIQMSAAMIAALIAFHKRTKDILSKAPPQVFVDADARRSLLDAAQGALDEAIAREESEIGP